jgi:CspA family cold shock protein
MTEKETGTVKWFNDSKGFGFIARDAGEDVFVHHTAVEGEGFRSLRENQRVEFSVEQGPKGLRAVGVIAL